MHSGLALAASQGSGVGSLLLLLLPLALLAFLMLSQRRRTRDAVALQQSLAIGDEVVTTSGMVGRVAALEPDEAHLEIAPGVIARFDRRAIGARRAPAGTVADGPVQES